MRALQSNGVEDRFALFFRQSLRVTRNQLVDIDVGAYDRGTHDEWPGPRSLTHFIDTCHDACAIGAEFPFDLECGSGLHASSTIPGAPDSTKPARHQPCDASSASRAAGTAARSPPEV